jgi:hypothetical protein
VGGPGGGRFGAGAGVAEAELGAARARPQVAAPRPAGSAPQRGAGVRARVALGGVGRVRAVARARGDLCLPRVGVAVGWRSWQCVRSITSIGFSLVRWEGGCATSHVAAQCAVSTARRAYGFLTLPKLAKSIF